jgi:uncharacterized protein
LNIRSIFYDARGRLRALWKLATFFVTAAFAFALLMVLVRPLLMLGAGWMGSHPAVDAAILLAALVAAHFVMIRFFDVDGRWAGVWMGEEAARPRPLAVGAILGTLAVALPSLLLVAGGWLSFEGAAGASWENVAFQSASLLLPAAFAEELLVRGYPMAVLRDSLGWPAALLITSVIFGVLHLGNPGASGQSVSLVVLAGIFLGAIVMVTGSLYAAGVAHFAWNWTMAAVLHAPVSGLEEFAAGGYRLVDTGPDWLTGGQWGPEGGAGAFIGMSAALWYLLRGRMNRTIAAPRGHRREEIHNG